MSGNSFKTPCKRLDESSLQFAIEYGSPFLFDYFVARIDPDAQFNRQAPESDNFSHITEHALHNLISTYCDHMGEKTDSRIFLKECEWRFNEGSPKQLLNDLKILLKEQY